MIFKYENVKKLGKGYYYIIWIKNLKISFMKFKYL